MPVPRRAAVSGAPAVSFARELPNSGDDGERRAAWCEGDGERRSRELDGVRERRHGAEERKELLGEWLRRLRKRLSSLDDERRSRGACRELEPEPREL